MKFVTYLQAKKLKELGFREPCLYHYGVDKKLHSNYIISGDLIRTENLERCYNGNQDLELPIDAPTLWETREWLLKEKKRFIEVESLENSNFSWTISKKELINEHEFWGWKNYDTPEEALLKGIDKCLKIYGK